MKKILKSFALLCTAMTVLASCTKEPDDPNGGAQTPEEDKTYEYVFSVSKAPLTKSILESDAIAFEEGDRIGVIAVTPEKTWTTTSEIFNAEGGVKFII